MYLKLFLILIIFLSACQTGRIACPKVKADKVKKSSVRKKMRYAERNTTASIEQVPEQTAPRPVSTRPEPKPAPLEHIDVEEWDCPKPGTKRALPKALKDNIRKNKKAYETHYRHRADSLESARQTTTLE